MKVRPAHLRYDVDEGFEEPQSHASILFEMKGDLNHGYSMPLYKQKKKNRSSLRKQQTKLRFISIQRQKSRSFNYDIRKLQPQKTIHKSLTLTKQQQPFFNIKKRNKISRQSSKITSNQYFKTSIIKQKRSQIGQNLQLKEYNIQEVKMIKQQQLNKGATLIYQDNRQSNTHGMLKKILKLKNANSFLQSKYNQSLLQKISESYINPKPDFISKANSIASKKLIEFHSDFQCGNLDFVTQINPFQYDLFLKADTNTMGHQNWFYFKLLNNSEEKKTIFLNICNLKRGFKMVKKGQKIFSRSRKISTDLKTSIQNEQQEWTEWQKISEEVTISLNQAYPSQENNNGKRKKLYKMSFAITLQPQCEYQFSLLPPYTYSQMLKQVQKIENSCQNATVQTLCYSLIGLAIPIITFTKPSSTPNKNVILISARIHPGQTCGSFVARGLLQNLSQNTEQINCLLQNYIIKVIPMLNPDGVILGNFRTNYLGNDLNRSFKEDNEAIFSQITSLKELGRQLKLQHGERFVCFLDLHGHSSQKNIFSYGPQYQTNHKNYLNSKILPKTLDSLSDQFDYNKCTFKLQECKINTARGFFLSVLNVMSFTIESSYALYDSKQEENKKNIDIKIQNWQSFGANIVNSINIWSLFSCSTEKKQNEVKISQTCSTKSNSLSLQIALVNKIKKQLKIQSVLVKKKVSKRKIIENEDSQGDLQEDSDGQSQSEDIPVKQRQRLQRKFIEGNSFNLFPRILRPAIIHPQVTPPAPIFSVSKIGPTGSKNSSLNNSILNARLKRNKYNSIKPMNVNNAYTQYLLKQVKGLQSLKPNIDKMKLQRKQSSLIQSYNLLK